MSFSKNVKNELIETECENCCRIACAYGLLLFSRSFSIHDISILTEHPGVAELYNNSVLLLSGKPAVITETAGGHYTVCVTNVKQRRDILNRLGLEDKTVRRKINLSILRNECCLGAFIRGVFLACGTTTDPNKDYHLEFTISSRILCECFIQLFDNLDMIPHVMERNGNNVVYFKNSTDIEDILTIMGAMENAMEIMGTKVYKDIRNQVNRKCNFENANFNRTIQAAAKQYDYVSLIVKCRGMDSLATELQEPARLRLENPDASTSEIQAMMSEQISKSGLHHRFKRIEKIAEEITEQNKE